MRLPIRLRLTLVFTLSMAVLLTVTGSFVYLRLGAELQRSTDAALLAQAEAVAGALGQQGSGQQGTGQQQNAFSPPNAARGGDLGTFAQVLGPGGRMLEPSPGPGARPAVPPSALRGSRRPAYLDLAVRGIEGTARIVVLPQGAGPGRVWVVVGTSAGNRQEALSALLVLMLIGGPVTLALAAAVGWAVAGAALRPVERMRQEAEAISVSDKGRRLPIPASRDEIARLGSTLNAMIGRLEAAFERERRFVADASHELRTPLAILKAELDLARSRSRTKPELLAAVRSASEETDRLIELAETLLVYSRVEGDRMPLRREVTDLDQLLRGACSALAARAAREGVAVQVDPNMVTAVIDPLRIRQAVENLVTNALAHTPRGGQIRVSATLAGDIVQLAVADTGPGFDPRVLPRAFEPFATGPAPSAGTGHPAGQGAGLGLAIVRAIAQAHGGQASAENPPGGGACVTVCLPATD
jgi:two-component system OmpR family sensor kinase